MSVCRFRKLFVGVGIALNVWIIYTIWQMSKYKSNNQIEGVFISSNDNDDNSGIDNNYAQNLEIPALVILGPAKTGTRSLIDAIASFENVMQYESERHFWSGSNKYCCRPWYNQSQWQWFIQKFINQEVKLSYLVNNITKHKNNTRCNIKRYKGQWLKKSTLRKLKDKYENIKNCIHPLYHNKSNDNQMMFCYLIEKGPSYINSPWVAPIYTTLLPKIKVIGLIRDPIKHVWSNYWAFGKIYDENGYDFEKDVDKIERYIHNKFIESKSFDLLREFCIEMNLNWKQDIGYKVMKNNFYLKLMGLYMRLRFIEPMDILIGLRTDSFIWFPLSFIHILFWINAYDDIINKQWINNFKMIQFEYLFSNISQAANKIKCWLSNNNERDCVYFDISSKHNNLTQNKNHALYPQQPSDNFVNVLKDLFYPFNEALYHLLHDRPDILIGKWVEWKY